MSADQNSQDDTALEQAAEQAVDALSSGRSEESVAQDLVATGWKKHEATEFVAHIGDLLQEKTADLQQQSALREARPAQKSTGSGAMGWLVWIGIILLINFLSWVFEWPFWIY